MPTTERSPPGATLLFPLHSVCFSLQFPFLLPVSTLRLPEARPWHISCPGKCWAKELGTGWAHPSLCFCQLEAGRQGLGVPPPTPRSGQRGWCWSPRFYPRRRKLARTVGPGKGPRGSQCRALQELQPASPVGRVATNQPGCVDSDSRVPPLASLLPPRQATASLRLCSYKTEVPIFLAALFAHRVSELRTDERR